MYLNYIKSILAQSKTSNHWPHSWSLRIILSIEEDLTRVASIHCWSQAKAAVVLQIRKSTLPEMWRQTEAKRLSAAAAIIPTEARTIRTHKSRSWPKHKISLKRWQLPLHFPNLPLRARWSQRQTLTQEMSVWLIHHSLLITISIHSDSNLLCSAKLGLPSSTKAKVQLTWSLKKQSQSRQPPSYQLSSIRITVIIIISKTLPQLSPMITKMKRGARISMIFPQIRRLIPVWHQIRIRKRTG